MILDNENKNLKIHEWIAKHTKAGNLNLVTGYFTIGGLNFLDRQTNDKIHQFRVMLGDIVQKETKERPIDLLNEDFGIDQAFGLKHKAEQAKEFLEQAKVQVKTLEPNFCHAKTYIFQGDNEDDHYFIMGSSNLTETGIGLQRNNNVELNEARRGNDREFEDYLHWFEALWQKPQAKATKQINGAPVNFKAYLISQILQIYRPYTPAEIYYKILFHLFATELAEFDQIAAKELTHLRETVIYHTLYPFQQQGVLSLIRMLQKYNGAILADAVGLGKTWQALAVMKYFELNGYEVLLLCPKKLAHNWRRYVHKQKSLFEADRFNFTIRYHTDLQGERLEQYHDGLTLTEYFQHNPKLLLVIDESHNLRNDKSMRYRFLVETILQQNKDVKVLLLSATPINTHLTDIRNQFKLLVKGDDQGFEQTELRLKSLQYLFSDAQKHFNDWQQRAGSTIGELIARLNQDFFHLTDALIVSRTRQMIEQQMTELAFPKHEKPINIYVSPKNFGTLTTAAAVIDALNFYMWAYRPAYFMQEAHVKKEVIHDEQQRQKFLVKMMYILLIKRLESSWLAFKLTVEKILRHHLRALQKIQRFLEQSEVEAEFELDFDEFDDESLEDVDLTELTIGGKQKIPLAAFSLNNLHAFGEAIQSDLVKIKALRDNIAAFETNFQAGTQSDEKLELLIAQIEHKRQARANPKVLIFTAFTATAEYLFQQLRQRGLSRLACVSGSMSKTLESGPDGQSNEKFYKDFEPILERFAPYTKLFKEKDWQRFYRAHGLTAPDNFAQWQACIRAYDPDTQWKLDHPVDILIATDCLSEGQNLQDCDCVVNYDIHWNPVRLIQRFGRIDRLGSPNDSIMGINFWLGDRNYEDFLNLKNRVERRMALMVLVGTEVTEITPEMEQLIADNPLLTKQEEKMAQQMQLTWDDLETTGRTLSLSDLSLEPFRQELLEYLHAQRKAFESMSNGVFSGCQGVNVPAGLIALLRHKDDGKYHLVYATPTGAAEMFNDYQILAALRAHKQAERNVPVGIDSSDPAELAKYSAMLKQWLQQQVPVALQHELDDLFTYGIKTPPEAQKTSAKEQAVLERYYRPEQFDLITWLIVS